MIWTVVLAKEAARQVEDLPQDRQQLIRNHLREMAQDPFAGDVSPLKGKRWKGRYRRRVGRYRVIFTPFHREHVVEVSAILIRSEKTYR